MIMKYTIKYNYNGQEYEDVYAPEAFGLQISDIADEALFGSLRRNNIQLENGYLRNIELFQEDKILPIYSAVTYTLGMGFITIPEDE